MPKNIILATIYKLVFKHNTNIAYVGQSTNINSRFKQHIKNAKDFSNIDNKLYFFMNLYGIHNFYIEVIEIFNNISYIHLHHYSFIFCYLLQFSYLYDLKPLFYIKKFQKLKLFNSSFLSKLFYVALHSISIQNIEFGYFIFLFTLLFLFFTIIFHLYSKIKIIQIYISMNFFTRIGVICN
jgi:hypothetical protein